MFSWDSEAAVGSVTTTILKTTVVTTICIDGLILNLKRVNTVLPIIRITLIILATICLDGLIVKHRRHFGKAWTIGIVICTRWTHLQKKSRFFGHYRCDHILQQKKLTSIGQVPKLNMRGRPTILFMRTCHLTKNDLFLENCLNSLEMTHKQKVFFIRRI